MIEYTYGELYAVGKHGEIFEVVSETDGLRGDAHVIGKKVAIDVLSTGAKVIVLPEYVGVDDYDNIIVPSGNWTGAKYRKVEQFISIPFYTAMERLQKGHVVYYKTREGYTRLTTDTSVEGLTGINSTDFGDLTNNIYWYYKK